MKSFCIFSFLFFVTNMVGQYELKGSIKGSNHQALAFASCVLKHNSNGQFVAGNVSDEQGNFVISKLASGHYTLEVSMLGFETKIEPNIEIRNENKMMDEIILTESAQTMEEVQISVRKMMYEKKIDRLIVNVQNSAMAAGSSALDIIERSPGMSVNRQAGSISMAGRDGVIVMINGKRQYIQENALIGLLSGINANNIEKLEIISTPPASFDAEGNAGFINIVLLQSENEGFNVNYGIALGGYKGFIGNSNATITYNKGRWSSFVDLTASTNQQTQDFRFYQTTHASNIATEKQTINDRFPIRNVGTLRLGTSYALGKSTISLAANGYINNWGMTSYSTAIISKNNLYENTIKSTQEENNDWQHGGISLGFSHVFSNKNTLSFSSDFLDYYTQNPTEYDNSSLIPTTEYAIAENSKSLKKTPIQLLVNALDYTYKMGSMSMESGAKYTMSRFTNEASVDYLQNQVWVRQAVYSSYAKMNENIGAAYTSISGNLSGKTSFKAGVRFEKSITTIKNEIDSVIVDRHLPYFFPSLYISHTLSENTTISMSAARRITRPSFNDLAPFLFFTDPTTLVTGNPALLPVISQSYSAEYKYKSKVISFQYSIDQNPIARFVPKVDQNSSNTIAKVRNFDQFKTLSATISFPYSIQKWWDVNLNLTGFVQKIFGTYESSNIEIQRMSANVFVNNTLVLPNSLSFEIGGFYNSGGFFGPFQNQAFGTLNAALMKKIKKSSISIGVDNVLNTMRFRSHFTDPATNNEFSNNMIFARANYKVVFRHSFGNSKVKSSMGKSNSTEERKRID